MEPKRELTAEDVDWLRFVLEQAVNTDGGHHKQWYLEAIAGRLLIDLPDHEAGIAP